MKACFAGKVACGTKAAKKRKAGKPAGQKD
jgi:hypothetical protein